jgi:hypothetical protein
VKVSLSKFIWVSQEENLRTMCMQAGLIPPSTYNAPPAGGASSSAEEEEESDMPPNKSPKVIDAELRKQHSDVLLALDDLLAITSDMPEVDLPLKADEIVGELLSGGVANSLVQWIDVSRPADTRLKAAGMSPEPAEVYILWK